MVLTTHLILRVGLGRLCWLLVKKTRIILGLTDDEQFAITYKQPETCRFLLQNSADPEQEDVLSRSPLDRIAVYLITDPLNPINIELKQIFLPYLDLNESLGKKQFTTLHKIALGLTSTSIDLEAYLQLSTADIETRCSIGRTPLMWVAGTSRTHAIKLLLKYGAKIDKIDAQGANVFHRTSTSDSGDTLESLRILLEAAASKPLLLKEMINKLSANETRPIDFASMHGKTSHVALFLSYGATPEPHPTIPEGIASIFYAIDHNHHEVIELFLKAGVQTDIKDNLNKSVLHLIAEDGDLKTIKIFARARPPIAIETRDLDVFGLTAMEQFEKHCDNFASMDEVYRAKRRKAFIELLEQVEKAYLEKQGRLDSSYVVECSEEEEEVIRASKFFDMNGNKFRDENDSNDSCSDSQYSEESEVFFDAFPDTGTDIFEKIGFSPTKGLENDFPFDVKGILG